MPSPFSTRLVETSYTEVLQYIDGIVQRILADLRAYGLRFEHGLLNCDTVVDTLRLEVARALDGERRQLMLMHHAWDAEEVGTSVDAWLRRWPQRMGFYVDVNKYTRAGAS